MRQLIFVLVALAASFTGSTESSDKVKRDAANDPKGEDTDGVKLMGGTSRFSHTEDRDPKHHHWEKEKIIQEVQSELEEIRKLQKGHKLKTKDEISSLREVFKHSPLVYIPDYIAAEELILGGHSQTKEVKNEKGFGRKHDTPVNHEKGKKTNRLEALIRSETFQRLLGLSRTKRTINSTPYYRWTNAVVPYLFVEGNTINQIKEYMMSMGRWEFNTCVRFAKYTATLKTEYNLDHDNYVNFLHNASGCWSYVGNQRSWKGQSISCCGKWACCHEIGHAVGYAHEQKNPLGKDYLWITKDTYTGSDYTSERYDATSDMHYGWSSTIRPLDPSMEYQNSFTEDWFYMWKLFSDVYNCQDLSCKSMAGVTCQNDGYISPLEGACQCVCPLGLDPATKCAQVYQGDTSRKSLSWPGESYAMLRTGQNCPAATMSSGQITMTSHADVTTSTNFDVHGSISGATMTTKFCVQSGQEETETKWPSGVYCLNRVGGQCPSGFDDGSIEFSDKHGATYTGTSIDADISGTKTVIHYCCRNDGGDEDPVKLPTSEPFALYPTWDDKCQSVRDMNFQYQKYTYTNILNEGSVVMTGTTPYVKTETNVMTVGICFYRPISYGCGGAYTLDSQNKVMTFKSPNYPQQYDNDKQCHWFFKGPPNSNIKLTFNHLDMESSSDGCYDSVEVREFYVGQAGRRYCGKSMVKSIITNYETLMVIMRTDRSTQRSGFSATVELITAEDYCYNVSDKGATYRGDISMTVDNQLCIPWYEARSNCRHHPFHEGDFYDGLDGNVCRNPGHGVRPWCYTSEECSRNYCDVCKKGSCYDTDTTCELDIAEDSGYCDSLNGKRFCRATCAYCSVDNIGNCPFGWKSFDGRCYKKFDKKGTFDEAKRTCASIGARVVTAKSKQEQDHLMTVVDGVDFVWLDLQDTHVEGEFTWGDGSSLSYTNWEPGEPNDSGGQDCVALNIVKPDWWDQSCQKKFFIACMMPETGGSCYDADSLCWAHILLHENYCETSDGKNFCKKACNLCRSLEKTKVCPDDWVEFNGNCYRNLGIKGTFADAKTKCAEHDAEITTAKSPDEQAHLVTLKGNSDHFWMNLQDDQTEGTWLWGDGSAATWTNWEKTEPNNWNDQDCGVLVLHVPEWWDQDCGLEKYIACKKKARGDTIGSLWCGRPTVPPDSSFVGDMKDSYSVGEKVTFSCNTHTLVTLDSTCTTDGSWTTGGYVCAACPDDWVQFNGSCYRNLGKKGTFAEAQGACGHYGAKITTAKNAEEQAHLITLKGESDHFWLDLQDNVTEGTWVWGDGNPVSWTNWESTEPNNWQDQDCALLVIDVPEWWDQDCELEKYIACKMEIKGGREICADQISGCLNLLKGAPDACTSSDEFSKQLCPKTCGVCGPSETCNAPITSTSQPRTINKGEFAEYSCADNEVLVSGNLKRACLGSEDLSGDVPVCQDKNTIAWPNSDHAIIPRVNGFWDWYAATNDADEMTIKRNGKVVAWHFYSGEAGEVTLQVYKVLSRNDENGEMEFQLMGYTHLDDVKADREYYYKLEPKDQIDVEPGYLIGIDYKRFDVIKSTSCDPETHPQGINGKYGYWGYSGHKIGSKSTFEKKDACVTYSLVAIVGPSEQ